MFLSNISYIIKYIIVNKEFVFNLDALVFKGGGGAIYKRVRVF